MAFVRVIDRPVLRLVSVDLGATAEITTLAELFDFAKDYLGLLKAAVIAAGIVPPGMEGAEQPLADLLGRLIKPGYWVIIPFILKCGEEQVPMSVARKQPCLKLSKANVHFPA